MDSSKEAVSSRHNWKMHIWIQNRKPAEVQVTWSPSIERCVEGIDVGSYLLARSYLQLICLQQRENSVLCHWICQPHLREGSRCGSIWLTKNSCIVFFEGWGEMCFCFLQFGLLFFVLYVLLVYFYFYFFWWKWT